MKIRSFFRYVLPLAAAAVTCSCGVRGHSQADAAAEDPSAAWFSLGVTAEGRAYAVALSPFGDEPDTLFVDKPLTSIVCMSSTSVAGLSAIGAADAVSGVSGRQYISDPGIRARGEDVIEVGYDAAPDYEAILTLSPDLVLAYQTSPVIPDYVTRLRSLGVRVMMVYDYLESHPLARAEYLRLYGCLTGRQSEADSLFDAVRGRYEHMAAIATDCLTRPGVLVNLPYADAWYIPGHENYFSTLVHDAGGEVLGTRPGSSSSVITLEEALALASDAEVWLNPGWMSSRADIAAVHPVIASFPVLAGGRIYNNIKRTTPSGGNDFWESGAVRPDRVLSDLLQIIHPELPAPDDSLEYYIEVK